MRRRIATFLEVLSLTVVCGAAPLRAQSSVAARELAAPAGDITSGVVALPTPIRLRSTHALVRLPRDATVSLALDAPGHLAIVVITPPGEANLWRIGLRAPNGMRVVDDDTLLDGAGRVTRTIGDVGQLFGDVAEWTALRFDVDARIAGAWTIECAPKAGEARGPCVAIIQDANSLALSASWKALRFVAGEPVSLAASWEGSSVPLEAKNVEATITAEDGTVLAASVRSTAEGVCVDVTPPSPGRYSIVLRASIESDRVGAPIARTLETAIDVASSGQRLTGAIERSAPDATREALVLGVVSNAESLVVAAEVWARDQDNGVPVCWLASIAPVTRGPRGATAALAFDRHWLGFARIPEGTPLELRNVRLHDRRTWGIVDVIDVVPLGPAMLAPPDDVRDVDELERGRAGGHAAPLTLTELPPADDAAPGNHALLIVHGYCSSGVTFPSSAFTGPVGVFLDPNQAKPNDAFAQTLLAYANQYKSYGVTAHSQGGLASLHLYTFYWSGLDWAKPNATGGNRLIQSVGSPYQGTPLAGNLSVLGQIFGAGCGAVTDMTPDGAAVWLSTIPTWARQKVWYWTTSFADGPGLDYCNFLSGLFLADPDDGVVEKVRGQLPGANNMGHTEGWCHTTGMDDPPQYNDATRNAEINAQAAR